MAFARINYFSRSLGKASSFSVVFPDDPSVPRPYAVFYLLHGLSDDDTIWMRRTSIERYVEGMPLVVVMPDGGRGWYTNAQIGPAYEDDLIKDVVGLVDRTLPVKAEAAGRAIGGLSMGGYGAVKLGLKHHAMFASVNSHSGALAILQEPLDTEGRKDLGPELDASSARARKAARRIPSASSSGSITGASPPCVSTAARETSCWNRTARFTAISKQCTLPMSTRSLSACIAGNTGTNTCAAIAFHARNLKIAR